MQIKGGMCTKEELLRLVRGTKLIWLPGEMVSCRYTLLNSNYGNFISLHQISRRAVGQCRQCTPEIP